MVPWVISDLAELRLAEAVRMTEDQTDAREGTAEVLDF